MKKYITLIALMGFFTVSASAQIFQATGIGDTADLAKKDAISNAVKFSVGEFIVNKEELSDDNFTQKVTSHSNAYVKSVKVKSQEKKGNEFFVDVEVDIESQKLIGVLKEMQVATISDAIDNNTLMEAINHFDKEDVNKKNFEDFKDLVDKLIFDPFRENKQIVHIKILGKLKPVQPEEKSEYFPLELPVSLKVDEGYVASVRRIIKQMELPSSQNGSKYDIYAYNLSKLSYKVDSYFLDQDKVIFFLNKVREFRMDDERLKVILLDKNQEVIKELTLTYEGDKRYAENNKYFIRFSKDLNSASDVANSITRKSAYLYDSLNYMTGTVDFKLQFGLKKDDIQNLKDIRIEFKY